MDEKCIIFSVISEIFDEKEFNSERYGDLLNWYDRDNFKNINILIAVLTLNNERVGAK